MVGDKIAELINTLKNGSMVGKDQVTLQYTKLYEAILKKIKEANFITDLEVSKDKRQIKVTLKYDEEGNSVINDVKRISKLSKRVYNSAKEIKPVKNGYGVAIITTPQGILLDKEAREKKVGGEVMFKIW